MIRLCLLPLLGGLLLQPALLHAQPTSPAFQRLDRNNDGELTRDEFSGALFDRLDANKDGKITAAEDRAFQQRRPGANPKRPMMNTPENIQAERNINYAGTDNSRQTLDLYLPKNRSSERLPVIVFIHGGGWQNGDKNGGYGRIAEFLKDGHYAGVSVGYRLTNQGSWPIQIHDCKAAIRWLRGNADKYGLDADRIGVFGPSAGGHLVAMLGVSGDVEELEGRLGEHTEESSAVQCVIDHFGPADIQTMGGWHDQPNSPEAKLIGGTVPENPELAKNASPVTYVTANDPPFLIIHGTADPVVPYAQSERLYELLLKAGVDATLIPVTGAGHGGFSSPEVPARMQIFFDKHLRGIDGKVSDEPITQQQRRGR
ncbi:alpha/beta hydrolase [Rubinisphaera brasiliensis]|uniref:Carboxylesterase type B n=1 Tax=Rubinisphaera brasiliensis (strain ATCC 49424 / DSM 5305 / JCM 21570 / IAM 15109 / NBRC 103401 / IFAM 1448) TaxID=756272 RepID=F0SMH2_RUBBR|nr:alpha/beta hydrolase [Rubinisphaera brasiliensis]ADY57734.1 Carboxylesterase type B [Rubinisphaera brasiliensis DSM 5305]